MANHYCASIRSKLLTVCRFGIFMGLVGQSLPAVGQTWTNGAADNDFLNASNWSSAPNFNSNATTLTVNLDGVNKATLNSTVTLIRTLKVGDGVGSVGEVLVDNSGSLTTDRNIELGDDASDLGVGTMTVNGGVVSTGRGLLIGPLANAGSVFNLNSGTVSVNSSGANIIGLRVGHSNNGNGSLNITGGTMTVINGVGRFSDSADGLAPSNASLAISGSGSLIVSNDLIRFGGQDTTTAANTASVSISDSGLLESTIGNVQFARANNSQVTVNLSGNGTMYASNSFTFGRGTGSTTTLTMTGGLIDGDRIDCGTQAGATATLNVSGGTISASSRSPSTAGFNQGSLYLGEGGPVVNLSGNAKIVAERLLINDGASVLNLTDSALVDIKGSVREISPGLLENGASTFDFTAQFFTGLWAEVLGKVRLNEVGTVLRVEGQSETMDAELPEDPALVVNYLDLFNAAI
ncbi:MAG TPA: hypothetical protein DCF63_12900, partial [Planctomycetaceae bacterium]|nr:hypothetical protein [Planctomycetaceae bacterium]